jgi:hypothetical protein
MSRSARQSTGRTDREDWTIRVGNVLAKPVGEVFCNVTGRNR